MNTFVSFIVVLGILIFVHELGHFLFAKLFRVKVLKFSLGFGPKLISKTVGETEYLISAFPLGGYVKMLGEGPDEAADTEEQERSFAARPVWNRFFIVLAGPLFNLLFSVFLFFLIFLIMGIPENRDTTEIGEVSSLSPAAQSGIEVGDRIVGIDGQSITSWMEVLTTVSTSEGRQLEFKIERGEEELIIPVRPRLDSVTNVFGEEVEQRFMIGIVKKE